MKKAAAAIVLFAMTFGVAGASSVNGEFEGNPVVKVQSGGKELQVEDVPATIYLGRTVVPIYMLKQLGAEVTWNADAYTVNVTMPTTRSDKPSAPEQVTDKPNAAAQEKIKLRKAYSWLKDTDMAMLTFVQQLQLLTTLEADDSFFALMEEDFKKLQNDYNASMQMAFDLTSKVTAYEDLRSIMDSQTKTMDQIRSAKSFFSIKQTNNAAEIAKGAQISIYNALRMARLNLQHTTELLRQLDLIEPAAGTTTSPANS
ncbi:stalk domain-containing protein [Paenibacillus chartarius]|uniref:Stalk domain-containing protein n=1 Tax=Paenibacillus chartarius TaxID=747481 RepID=A0ABV6DPU5_9BACL